MDKALLIVESPAKAKTINKYLGSGYRVMASMGHVRDLPKSKLGVDVDKDFEPQYIIIPEREKVVGELRAAARTASSIILAADPDREGEAICWHLKAIFDDGKKPVFRVRLQEITKQAVEDAVRHMGELNVHMFEAQQARRVLDRLVGYKISPLLWKKIGRGLSAGRVQSIALRLVVEREREIRAFRKEEFWTIFAYLEASLPPRFKAALSKIDGKKAKIPDGASAQAIVDALKGARYVVRDVAVTEKKRNPPPPYITSTLQQEAFRLLRFPVKKTMSVAQKLYEGLPLGERGPMGLITYMRTDSVRISAEAQAWARAAIVQSFSAAHVPSHPRVHANKGKAQDAHEAIRPTSPELTPEAVRPYLKKEEFSLYQLIWNRFFASQMSAAVLEETALTIAAGERFLFTVKGGVIKFKGWWELYPKKEEDEEDALPPVKKDETLTLAELEPKQSFTQPPARYTEGTLVKELEAKGIGRPSTYAPIIATLQNRVYVVKEENKFVPTDLGMFVTDFLVKHFPDLMEYKFTARMEGELDEVSEGTLDWVGAMRDFYGRLQNDLAAAGKVESVAGTGIPLDEKCPKCGKPLVNKGGKFGRFKSCSGYPECDYSDDLYKKSEPVPLEEKCPTCGANLVQRVGRYGMFVACSNYPKCRFIKGKEKVDTGIACPQGCGGTLLKRKTKREKFFYGCSSFPKCRFATWDEPLPESCPKCGRPFVLRKTTKKDGTYKHCVDENCGWREPASPPAVPPRPAGEEPEPAGKDGDSREDRGGAPDKPGPEAGGV
ncbi:MAG TPA: type I DNA topoisomerase [Candidatus Aminicenantes bacterium]|nr:MAG: DNA topoisomerase 1 [Candidatus Aminicenantes bacterium ADurb.Bin147]HOY98536.1 type I DNA topoisomerase [Candidatus Aminicenantes bacterium]